MKILLLLFIPTLSFADCYRVCETWDTFCKSPKQIVATKCRLGVPVKHEQCKALGISTRYLIRGGGSLVDGMPCSEINKVTEFNEVKL